MKITVIQKAVTSKKPSNFCPWMIDSPDGPAPSK